MQFEHLEADDHLRFAFFKLVLHPEMAAPEERLKLHRVTAILCDVDYRSR